MDSFIAFLQNQQFAMIAALAVPFLIKYVPAFKNVSNEILALVAALSAFLTNVFGPAQAHAGFFSGAASVLSPFVVAFVSAGEALATKLIHDNILNPAYKALGLKTPRPDPK